VLKQHSSQTALVCDLTALNAEERERHQVVLEQLQKLVQEVKDLPQGYTFRLVADTATLLFIAEFMMLESCCCPFLDLRLDIETEQGPAWLTLTGPEGVKEFLKAELGIG
jgi:hypothetical protein